MEEQCLKQVGCNTNTSLSRGLSVRCVHGVHIGDFIPTTHRMHLLPSAWVVRPDNWVMSEFSGSVTSDKVTYAGSVVPSTACACTGVSRNVTAYMVADLFVFGPVVLVCATSPYTWLRTCSYLDPWVLCAWQ